MLIQLFWNTPREIIEATLLINVLMKMVYHMVYPHLYRNNNNASITGCSHINCDGEWCPLSIVVPDVGTDMH